MKKARKDPFRAFPKRGKECVLKKVIDNIEEIVCIIALTVMTILTFANVVTRYVFNFSMNFAEEIST